MSCEITSGIGIAACKVGVAGIKTLWLGNYADFKTGITQDPTTELIDSLPEATIFRFDLSRATGQAMETVTAGADNESVFMDQKISVQFSALSQAKRNIINSLIKGRWVAFVELANGKIQLYGQNEGLDCVGGSADSGKAKADFVGYKLDFTGQEADPASTLENYTSTPFDNYVDITVSATQATA
jgi:hypothetical protein